MAFCIGFYAYASYYRPYMGRSTPTTAFEQFDTFPIQCRHIEHMHEGVWFRKNHL